MQILIEALEDSLQLMLDLDPTVLVPVMLTLRVTLSSLAVSTMIGLPIGVSLGMAVKIPARGLLLAALYTGMGLPPVVVGLIIFFMTFNQSIFDIFNL